MIVDDVHWSDAASLRWLVYAARRLDGVPLALLLAARPTEDPLLDELAASAGVLRPGELTAIEPLIESALGAPPDPAA